MSTLMRFTAVMCLLVQPDGAGSGFTHGRVWQQTLKSLCLISQVQVAARYSQATRTCPKFPVLARQPADTVTTIV